ncbi:ABC transporter substrate-binding protein [Oceanibium sediminis]|uniref:ABC transporter substrate-binding protein n=1 Tax=Oceanibium sediminis TaxID=2026339 RepID=UPI000DD3D591|nr:sugar ABC transporter substrate-binding protein [Oceanibium sediminis]
MTKSFWLRSTAVALALGLSGGATSAETLRVYFNAGHGYDTYMDAIAEFEADNPGWEVQFEKFQWPDLRTKLVADFAADNAPDLVANPGGWVPEFAFKDLLTPLDELAARDQAEFDFPGDWFDSAVAQNTINDQIYGLQIHLTCATLVYNKDMLADAGYDAPPTTWEEFREVAKATTKPGVFGFAPNSAFIYYWPWVFQNGGEYYNSEIGEVGIGSDASIEALQFLADLIHEDRSAPVPVAGADYEGPQKLFTSERAAMILTGPWDINPIRTGNPELNWGVAPSLTNAEQATIQGGVALSIPKGATHPDMAWELAKRLTSLEVEVETSLQYSMTMPRKSWLADERVQADPLLGQFGSCLPYSQPVQLPLSLTGKYDPAVDTVIQTAFEEVLYSNEPAADVLPEAAAEANKIIAGK